MKKICIVVSVATFVKNFMLIDLYAMSQHFHITIICSDEIDFEKQFGLICTSKQLKIHRKINFLQDIKSLLLLIGYFNNNKFDVILSVTPKANFLAMLAGFITRMPIRVIFFTGQVWANKIGLKRYFLKSIDKLIAYLSTYTLVAGDGQRQFLIAQGVIKKQKSTMMLHSLELDRFKVDKHIKQRLLAKYHLKDGDVVLMFLGRLNKDKGILELIKVVSYLLEKKENLAIFLVGENEGDIDKEISNFAQLKNVFNIGVVDNPAEILNLANILLLPSHREGYGYALIEAAAMSIPAIVSDIYGMQDSVVDGQTGLKHKVGNVADMQQKYLMLINDKDLVNTLGENARNRVRLTFNKENTSTLFVNYFIRLAEHQYCS